jgi:hypothetical protein
VRGAGGRGAAGEEGGLLHRRGGRPGTKETPPGRRRTIFFNWVDKWACCPCQQA